jgi:ferredoxin
MGTEGSPGTAVFSLVGKVNNTGLVEVPMGISLHDLIYSVGGGLPKGRTFKAVQTGGPSGGCIPGSMLDLPVDFDRLTEVGSMMGSGGMVIMDDRTCMVDIARYFLEFLKEESCGKCAPCREGIKRMLEILNRITSGDAHPGDLDTLEYLAKTVQMASLCGLGKSAPNPVLSTLRYFREEYEQHIAEKFCPAGVCRELVAYRVIEEKCKGCGLCVKACPREGISGSLKQPHMIDQVKCIQCGACFEACRLDAIEVIPKAAAGGNGNGHGGAVVAKTGAGAEAPSRVGGQRRAS